MLKGLLKFLFMMVAIPFLFSLSILIIAIYYQFLFTPFLHYELLSGWIWILIIFFGFILVVWLFEILKRMQMERIFKFYVWTIGVPTPLILWGLTYHYLGWWEFDRLGWIPPIFYIIMIWTSVAADGWGFGITFANEENVSNKGSKYNKKKQDNSYVDMQDAKKNKLKRKKIAFEEIKKNNLVERGRAVGIEIDTKKSIEVLQNEVKEREEYIKLNATKDDSEGNDFDYVKKIEEISALKDSGVISESEFTKLKNKIIDRA